MGKRNGGFSLIETLVSIVILGAMVVPTCTALVMTVKLNDKTEKMLQAQLAVSSAVETLMADGITYDCTDEKFSFDGQFPDVNIMADKENDGDPFYTVTVTSTDGLVSVDTVIREVTADEKA